MNIAETISFDKEGEAVGKGLLLRARHHVHKLFLTLIIILVALLSFGMGRLTGNEGGEAVRIEYDPAISNTQPPTSNQAATSQALTPIESSKLKIENSTAVIASKSGSKYHYPSCPGAKQIKESNKITFPSAQAAEAAGYTLASNCSPR